MSNGTLNDAMTELQQAAGKLRTAFKAAAVKQVLSATMTGHIAALDATIKAQRSTINQLKKNAEQALGFIGQIMNNTEDPHVAHFVNMAEQWLSKGFAPVMVASFEVRNTWTPVNKQPPTGIPLLCYHTDWIDEDFNPTGIREGFYNPNGDPDDWTTAKWNNCSDRYMTFYDTPSHWMLPEAPEMSEQKAALPPPWLSVEQFEKSGYKGRCWILYKTRPVICTYTGKLYTFGSSNGVYMTECISGVIPLPTPSAEL